MPRSFLAILSAALSMNVAAMAGANPVATVTGGAVEGRLNNSGAVFKGIPFAQPPVGDLRWREPVRVKAWSGTRDAGEYGAPCAQIDQGWNKQNAAAGKEDCLYLNVWAPEWPPKASRPVMFWIHGGANMGGSGSGGLFDRDVLTRRGVVLVTVEYRLGALGFLAHPELSAESPHHASGNYGLLDQIAALTWVKENIAKFGGDPANVTVFGQSAGAQDLGLLMTSPLAKGLFARAIAESGTVIIDGRLTPPLAQAEQNGLKSGDLKTLRSLPVEQIIEASRHGLPTAPNVDGFVLPQPPAAVFAKGEEQHIPMIIGNNGRERSFKGTPEVLEKAIRNRFGAVAPEALKLYGPDQAGAYPPYGSAGDQFSTDTSFRCTAVAIAEWHRAAGNVVYQYEFTHGSPEKGAPHSAELGFVFGDQTKDAPAALRTLADDMHQYWTNFAKTGDPNASGLPVWPQYDVHAQGYIEFSSEGPVVKSNLRRPFCEVFQKTLLGVTRGPEI